MGGLRTKLKDIRNNFPLLTPAPDIIVLTETWLTGKHHDAELSLCNYTIYRRDRPYNNLVTRSGGVLIAISDKYYSSLRFLTLPEHTTCIDQLAVTVHIGAVKIIIGAVYIPPGEDYNEADYSAHADAIKNLSSLHPPTN